MTITIGGGHVAGQPNEVWDITAHVCVEAGGVAHAMHIYMVQALDHWPTANTYSRNGLKASLDPTLDITLQPGQCTNMTRRITFDSYSWAHQSDIAILAWAQEQQATSPPSDRAFVYQASMRRWPLIIDCNGNGVPDDEDIANGTSLDCNHNGVPDECEPGGTTDCNGNSIHDLCDIYNGTSLDCNTNGVPDECDLAAGTSHDCNANNIPDECDIRSGFSQDCNTNGIPDECDPDCNQNGHPDSCDIANGTSQDCNHNGIPDECDLAAGTSHDCNNNSIPDECDIAAHTVPDCNGNGIPDACDIANCNGSPWCSDCNSNGIPDVCDLLTVFTAQSPVYTPLGYGYPKTFDLGVAPDAVGDVTLTFLAYGDVNGNDEHVYASINGTQVGTLYGAGYFQCVANQTASVVVPMATYNTLKAGAAGAVTLLITPQSGVTYNQCTNATTIQVTITYNRASDSGDQNHNGIPDECEQEPQLCAGDTNCDGGITFADIDWFVEALNGESGWAHLPCPWLSADCNHDGGVTFADIDPFVSLIGTSCP
jgi:hypothetical protein